MTRSISATARHLFDAIESSPKTQKEIAREAGFASQNMLSMMKTGESKVPINRIPRLSQALGIAQATFINIALNEYHPDLHEVITDQFGIGLSSGERALLEVFDEAQNVAPSSSTPVCVTLCWVCLCSSGGCRKSLGRAVERA